MYSSTNNPTLLLGDFNARSAELLDYMKKDNCNKEPITRQFPMQKRNNCDKQINAHGKKVIDLCKSFDLHILNGRHDGDPWGAFTHYNKNKGASTVALAVISDSLSRDIKIFYVLPQLELSYHCKIVVQITNIKQASSPVNCKYNWNELPRGYKWQDSSQSAFKEAFNSLEIQNHIGECRQLLEAGLIESTAKKIQEILITAANKSLDRQKGKPSINPQGTKKGKKRKKWFDLECQKVKQNTRKLSIKKHVEPLNVNMKTQHASTLKQYKKLCSGKKESYHQKEINNLEKNTDDPINFWESWKNIGDEYWEDPLDKDKIDWLKWENYYKDLYRGVSQRRKSGNLTIPDTLFVSNFSAKELTRGH